MKKEKRLLISWTIMLMMLLNAFLPLNTAYAGGTGTDKTSVLTNVKSIINQGGAIINEGGTLNSTDPISVEISFGVPVEGDDPTPANPVKKGDTATFELSSAFKLISGAEINLVDTGVGNITVGHVSFTTDPVTKMVVANVVFDGDDTVFDGTHNTVTCKFNADLEYDNSGNAGSVGDHIVTILEKTYTVTVPPAEIVYNVEKSGTPDLANKSIEWTVDISATQAGEDIDLSGYKFYDDLKTVGTYIPDSFTVDGSSATPVANDNTLGYVFPEGSISKKIIKFKTDIPDDAYYTASEQKITNKAQLRNSEDSVVKEGQIEVKFTPEWIEKDGGASDSGSSGVYDPKNRTITWTITVDQMGASLNNVIITDLLPKGLTLKSASWQAWDGTKWGTANTVTPTESGEYDIGNINSEILLTIITNVPDETYTTGITNYKNSASVRWDGLSGPGLGTGNINVGVGYNAIKKSGVADTSTRKIHWTVTVDTRGQIIPELKAYDLLVYGGSSGFDITKVEGIPSDIHAADLTPRYDQKYVADSFEGQGLNVTVYPITQDGKQVADLMEITGFSISSPNTFEFDSLVVNPDIFAGNKTSSVWNTATLFSGNVKLNEASGKVDYPSKMLSKEMLKREALSDPAAGVNDRTKDAKEGFDYQDKSVIFCLSINADGIDLNNMTNAAGETLGKAIVTDTLPDGWQFEEITAGKNYLVFEGTGNPDGTVRAIDTTPDTVADLDASFSEKTAVFTFDTLDKPYVILVKARPAGETAAEYFNTNKTTTVRNNLALETANWTPGVTSFQDVSIDSNILEKSLNSPEAGVLNWTVDYKPYDLQQPGTKLEDTLPIGIDLRTDSNGNLLIDGNIAAHEMTLNADGSYTLGSEVALKNGENIFYDNENRILTFIIPDNTKAYRFSYITDITGEPGTISNKVSLYGNGSNQEETAQPYVITNADGEASMKTNGWISIKKVDGLGSPLAGAEFTIFSSDGKTVIRKGITGNDGTIKLKVIPDGDYILRETTAPQGYTEEIAVHSLSVTTEGTTVITSIDGKTGKNANAITIQDFAEDTAGNLTISKTVGGNAADPTKQFDFTLTLDGADGTYNYIGNGVPNGTIRGGDKISLADGQSVTIVGLPKGTKYTVAEADYSGDGYSAVSTGATGVIVADATQTASFTNSRNAVVPGNPTNTTGSLTVKKTVAGDLGDREQSFTFVVNLGARGRYHYTGSKNGTIASGQAITLKHDQYIVIKGLPVGTTYLVTEKEADQNGYITSSRGASGKITKSGNTALFVNKKSSVPKTGDDNIGHIGKIGLIVFTLTLLILIGLKFIFHIEMRE